MNIFIYDDKKAKTEIIEIDDAKVEDNPNLEFFNDNDIRTVWHSGEEEWYLSIIDVVRFLTDSTDSKQYIKRMRQRDKELSYELSNPFHLLKQNPLKYGWLKSEQNV